jgi:predicted transcriptional regulator
MSKQAKKSTPPPPRPSSITPELGAQILREYNTATPRPSAASIASRLGLSPRSVQRYLKKHKEAVSLMTEKEVEAELVVGAMPGAIAEVKALTRDLPITKLCRVMQAAESQYERYKDDDPQLAGGYLDQMRKCAVEMAKWLGLDKGLGVQDNTLRITVNWRRGQ